MINREDMLELTRRMTPARSHIDRIAGAYYDAEGYIDGTFNTHFLKLSTEEKTKNLELAKAVLQAETNKQLKDYRIPAEKYGMRIYKSVRNSCLSEPVESVMEIETTYGNIFEVLYIHREQALWYQTGIRYLEKLPY